MLEIFAKLLAGLGLYFSGVRGLRSNLQQIPGRRFRNLVGKATGNPISAAISGFLMGTVTQTSIGVTVILAGLVSQGAAVLSQALPVVAWSNLGLVTLVYLSNLNIHIFAMTMIGICGVSINFGLGGKLKGLMPPFFSLGLILFGLKLMKEGTSGAVTSTEFGLIAGHASLPLIALAIGILLRVPIQSSSAVAVIGIILHSAGVFSIDETILTLIGTSFGTGLCIFLLTAHFQGVMRQITLFEALINTLSGCVMLALFLIDYFTEAHFIFDQIRTWSGDVNLEFANIFLLQQALCVIFAYLLLPRAPRFLERWAPTTAEQDLSRPRFIHDQAAYDVETALSLTEQELRGLLGRLPSYLNDVRSDCPSPAAPPPSVQHAASKAVMTEIGSLMAEISLRPIKSPAASLTLLRLQSYLSLTDDLEDGVFQITQELTALLRGRAEHPALASLVHNIVESLDLLLVTAHEASHLRRDEIFTLQRLTTNTGEAIDRLRQKYFSDSEQLDHQQRCILLSATTQYERIMLNLHQLARNLNTSANITTP